MTSLRLVTLLLLLLWTLPSLGVERLYHAEVEVADQGAQARAEGMARAMREVLVKVSGSARASRDEALRPGLQGASRYAQRYQYRTEAIAEDEQRLDGQGRLQTTRLLMEVEFEPRGIDALLRNHGYSVWGATRPEVLVWIGVEQGGQRLLVGANDAGLVRQVLAQTARQRGLPLRLPLLDHQDQAEVQAADIWGGFWGDIQQASLRYAPQAILIGRLAPDVGGQWEIDWVLLHDEEQHRWQMRSDDLHQLIASGVHESTDWLAARFAKFAHHSDGELYLWVDDVVDFAAYRRVMDYLSGINGVQHILLDSTDNDRLQLRLQVDGGREVLMRTIALGRTLERVEQELNVDSVMRYRLRH